MPKKPENLVGRVFGNLRVLEITKERASNGSAILKCLCSCPKASIRYVPSKALKSGSTIGCGCMQKIQTKLLNTKHGASAIKEKENAQLDYSLWQGMKQRCLDKNHKNFDSYGGRGIKIFNIWLTNFIAYASYIRSLPNCPEETLLISRKGGKRLHLSVDRINNDGNYEPGNLKWSTKKEQNNNRRDNLIIKFKGEELTLQQAIDKYAVVCSNTVRSRIYQYNWSIEDALLTPIKSSKPISSRVLVRFKNITQRLSNA